MSAVEQGHAPAGVTGDSTDLRSRVRTRWHRWRWPVGVLVVVVVAVVVLVVLTPRRSDVPLDVRNVGDDGARAVAEVLRRQGVDVGRSSNAQDAVRQAGSGATLAVVGGASLDDAALDALAGARADLVLVGVDPAVVARLTQDRVAVAPEGTVPAVPLDAGCADPDAVAAGRIAVGGATFTADDDATTCFALPDGSAAVVSVVLDDGRRVDVLGSTDLVRNASVTREGNAALALRSLGRHDSLVWFLPRDPALEGEGGAAGMTGPGLLDLLPDWARSMTLLAAFVLLGTVLWRGRRLGPVVSEELPVEVRAVESTYGRGRLYRRAAARGHSAAALRAGAADRMARRVGLPRSADGPSLVDSVARATGRDPLEVSSVLHGPPPPDDAAFAALIHQLDQLEREVDRS